jgi:hypothetical protein
MSDTSRETVEKLADSLLCLDIQDRAVKSTLLALLDENEQLTKELACRDALISDHLRTMMHLENRLDALAHRIENWTEAAEGKAEPEPEPETIQCEKCKIRSLAPTPPRCWLDDCPRKLPTPSE